MSKQDKTGSIDCSEDQADSIDVMPTYNTPEPMRHGTQEGEYRGMSEEYQDAPIVLSTESSGSEFAMTVPPLSLRDMEEAEGKSRKRCIPSMEDGREIKKGHMINKDDRHVENTRWNMKVTKANISKFTLVIFDGEFSDRTDIETVDIPDMVRVIGKRCFSGCKSLTKVSIPSSVTDIGKECFSVCESLTSVVIPSSLTVIGDGCFALCSSLTLIFIPSSVTVIGTGCFLGCRSLESLTIPSKLRSRVPYLFNALGLPTGVPSRCRITYYESYENET